MLKSQTVNLLPIMRRLNWVKMEFSELAMSQFPP
jgi:hypothetical protein